MRKCFHLIPGFLVASLLTACGGGSSPGPITPPSAPETYTVGGALSGLASPGSVVLRLSAGTQSEDLTLGADGNFAFRAELDDASSYTVTLISEPDTQDCTVVSGSGVIADSDVSNVSVACVDTVFSVGGTVANLAADQSVELRLIANNTDESLTVSSSGIFTFLAELEDEESYTVTLESEPRTQDCSLSSGTGVIDESDVSNIAVACVDIFSSISGVLSVASNTVVDSDLNDPFALFTDNSSFENAQEIDNLNSIQGFLTKDATGFSGDEFEISTDVDDYYRVSLQAGQVIRMQVVDFDRFDVDNRYSGDLDMALHRDNVDRTEVSLSQSVTEFEEIVVEDDGVYFIRAYAFSGTSKYVLEITTGDAATAVNRPSMDFIPGQAIVTLNDNVQALSVNDASLMSTLAMSHHDKSRATLASFLDTKLEAYKKQMGLSSGSNTLALSATADEKARENARKYETLRHIKRMNHSAGIALAEPNYLRQAYLTPDDQFYNLQWHYPAMNLPQAWDITTGTPASGDVVVAVVDTGVFLAHPDLTNKLVDGFDFISDISNALDGDGIDDNPDDPGDSLSAGASSWHGTHVAGTVAAETNNGTGAAGVSWGAKIMPLRVLGARGGSSYDIMQSVRFAARMSNDSGTIPAQRADIINLSLGGEGSSISEENLYQEVYDSGVIIVAAAGNDNTDRLSFPASYPGVISVSALDAVDQRAPYSNFGSAIDIAAPGGDATVDRGGDGQPDGVLSTLVDDSSGQRRAILSFYQGTSMAAPHVAGMIALMKAVHPGLTPQEVDTLLMSGSMTRDAGTPGVDNIFGYGVADALASVQAAQALALGDDLPEPPPSIVASPVNISIGTLSSSTVTLSNQGGGTPTIESIGNIPPWLNVSAESVDAQGLGTYRLAIDRTGLVNGIFLETITFNISGGLSLDVRVSMTVGIIESQGELSRLYAVLFDPDANDGAGESINLAAQIVNIGDGQVRYTFSGVAPGSYFVFAGTDIDNDGFICQAGEGCGAYPSMNQATRVETGADDITDLDFVTDIVAGFSNLGSASTALNSTQGPLIRRPGTLVEGGPEGKKIPEAK